MSWVTSMAQRAWIGYAERLAPGLAQLAGAEPAEVVAMNSLTVNLHLLLASFYRPTSTRHRILIEAGAFSSDRHALVSQIRWHGYDPATALVEVAPRPGEELLRTEDIEARIAAEGAGLALVLWPGVQYRTGQAFDLARSGAQRASYRRSSSGFDLAHAIGNLPLALHDSDADFAVWCSYKYLNGGPGAIGGAFVHERHARDVQLPRLTGWWGKQSGHALSHERRIRAVGRRGGLAGQQSARAVSGTTVSNRWRCLRPLGWPHCARSRSASRVFCTPPCSAQCGQDIEVITGTDPQAARLPALGPRPRRHRAGAARVRRLGPSGSVVVDWREPDTIRLAPVPFYNTFA